MAKEVKTKKTKIFDKVLKRFDHAFVEVGGKKKYLPVLVKGDIASLFIFITKELEKGDSNE